jgi:deoxyribonuclease (pyrimidine dimer)
MVRINLFEPRKLSDQHLVAEYDEILMLLGYVRKYPKLGKIPEKYCLGKGHMLFFKNKLQYLKMRHELLKKEMRNRGFATNVTIDLSEFPKPLINDWKPSLEDKKIIKARIIDRLKKRPGFYRYHGRKAMPGHLIELINKG